MKRDSGMLLISILGIMAVVLMLMGAFLSSSQQGMFRAAHYRDLIRAEQAAKGGLNEIIAILEADKNFDKPLQGSLDGATYSITFDTSKTNYSVNNLSGARGSSDRDGNYKDLPLSAQKHSVYPHTADLIVVAQCGTSRRVFHTLVQEGVSSLNSATSVGPIKLAGNVSIDGVKSAIPNGNSGQNIPAAGGLASKFQSHDSKAENTTIAWDGQPGNDAFELSALSKLQTAAPHADGKAFSDNLTSLLDGTNKLIRSGAADSIPDIKVAAKVEEGLIDGTPLDGPLTGLNAPKYIFVQGKRSLTTTPSDNTVNSLALAGGALFVKGDLNVKGWIRGTGTVYVDGDVTIDGGNGIIETAQPVGTALIASGNITLKGGSKLDNLIPQLNDGSKFLDPSTKQSYDDLLQELNNYKNSAGGADQLASIAGKISTTTGIFDPAAWGKFLDANALLSNPASILTTLADIITNYINDPDRQANTVLDILGQIVPWTNPIPEPDGRYPQGLIGGRIPRLTTRLNPLGGVGIPSDIPPAEIAKFTRSLEELAYHMRENARNIDFNLLSISDPTTSQLLTSFSDLDALFPPASGGGGGNAVPYNMFSSQRLGQALGQMNVRVNDQYFIQAGSVPFPDVRVVLALLLADTRGHDDLVYKPKFRVASTYADQSVTDPARADALARAQRNAFIKFNPLDVKNGRIDLSFMGSFAYQGIIYAKGNIVSEKDTKLRMLGSLISLGKIDLKADSSLTFNEEYCSLFGSLLPLGIVHFEEL